MTHAERAEIERATPPGVVLSFVPHDDAHFVRLTAKPCPLLGADNLCTVYAVRPYNCRRWGCFRDDVTCEPLDNQPVPAVLLVDRAKRRQYAVMQRHAQRWARAHGWVAE